MSLSESLKKLKYDKRMLHWNLRQKTLTKEEHKKHLESLEDLSEKETDLQKDTVNKDSSSES